MEEEKGRVEWVPKRVRHDEEKGNEQRKEEESGGYVKKYELHECGLHGFIRITLMRMTRIITNDTNRSVIANEVDSPDEDRESNP